jgi:putative nucleotidyltransferase with HDIG domain
MAKYLLLYKHYLKKYADAIGYTRQFLKESAAKNPLDLHPWGLPEHRMDHTLLVLKNSLLLAKNRKVNLDVVALSAILHDIAAFSSERKKHAEEGAKIAEEYLKKHGYPDDLVQKVVHSIRVHTGPSAFSPRSDEAKILQDADTIDKVGALSITTFLLHYGSKKMLPEQVLAELKKDMPERLRWYYRTMNFPQGKKMMGEGCSYIRDFIQKLESETDLPRS